MSNKINYMRRSDAVQSDKQGAMINKPMMEQGHNNRVERMSEAFSDVGIEEFAESVNG